MSNANETKTAIETKNWLDDFFAELGNDPEVIELNRLEAKKEAVRMAKVTELSAKLAKLEVEYSALSNKTYKLNSKSVTVNGTSDDFNSFTVNIGKANENRRRRNLFLMSEDIKDIKAQINTVKNS